MPPSPHRFLEPNPQPFWPNQAGFANFTYYGVPAMFDIIKTEPVTGPSRKYCDWCWRKKITFVPAVLEPEHEQHICMNCIDRISLLQMEGADPAELRPPWQPDGRARRANQLYLTKIPNIAVAIIAAFEVGQWVP